jgi:hypothetical protein
LPTNDVTVVPASSAVKTPAFTAEVEPKTGAELARVIGQVLSVDGKVLARARTIAGIKE